jgi:1-pyrroline-5-carboxylate dehydrogenase
VTTSYAEFATVDPFEGMTTQSPGHVQNFVGGKWITESSIRDDIVDPLNDGRFLDVPDTSNMAPFLDGLAACPKTGLHNPMKNVDRYVHLGRVCAKAAALLATPDVESLFCETHSASNAKELATMPE